MSLWQRLTQRKQLAAPDLRDGAGGWSAVAGLGPGAPFGRGDRPPDDARRQYDDALLALSLIHISEPTSPY